MLWIVLFLWGVRLRAEGQGGVSPFHLSPGCIRGAGSVLFWWLGLLLIFLVWIAPGFFARHLPWANRASSSLNHRRLDDRESLRARTAWAQKKNPTSRCTNKSAEVGHLFVHSFFGTFHNANRKKVSVGFSLLFLLCYFCSCTCLQIWMSMYMHMFAEYVYDINEFCVCSCQFILCKCVCNCNCSKCKYWCECISICICFFSWMVLCVCNVFHPMQLRHVWLHLHGFDMLVNTYENICFCVILHFLCVASCFFCVSSFRRALFLCVFLSASPTFCDFLFRMFFISVIVTDLSVRYIASRGFFFLVREFLSKICLFDFLVWNL